MANGLKLEGQRFGHLTVLKKLDERENRYVVWLCRCDCGNEIKVNTRHLMGVRTKSWTLAHRDKR